MPAIESSNRNQELLQELSDLRRQFALLELERERLRTIADSPFDWSYLTSPDGSILFCSPSCQQITGWPAGDFLSNPRLFDDIVYPEDQPLFCTHRQDEHQNDDPHTLSFRIVKPDGEVRWIEHRCWPVLGADGGCSGRRVSNRDITEQRCAEQALQQALAQAAERQQTLVDIPQAVMDGAKNSHLVYLDRNFNFLRVNEAYAKTCGYTPAEMIGKNHFALYPNPENEAIFARVCDTGVPVEFHDKLFVFPDQPNRGPTYWDWTLTPVKDSAGVVVGLVFSLVDTTARKQVEANLQASKERFELAVRGSGVGIWDWNIRTGKVYYSPRWKTLFGYEEDEIGDGFEDWAGLLHPDEGESIIKFQEDFLKGTSPTVAAEYRLRHKDGSYRWIEAHAVVVRDEDGKACRLVGSHGDITARKQAEEDLKTLNETLELRVAERTEAIQLLHSIASMANQVQNAEQAIECCLQRLAIYNGWSFGHALLPAADNPDELVPRCVRYPQDPDRFHRFREVTLGMRFRRGEDLPGRAFASGQPEWATNLHHDLTPCRAAVAGELGLGTAIAFPILVGEKVAGVLELFSNRVIRPDRRTTDTMVGVGLQLGRVLERASFEEHLLTIAEEIRQGMAQDLHDDVGQELTGLGLKMETLAEMLASTQSPAGTLAADIALALDRTRGKVRKLSRGLLPVELEEGLLASALGQLAATATAGSAIACTFDCFHPDPVFSRRAAMHLYRIAQEAVSNAVRHSGAGGIRITLDQENGEMALTIEDDGEGMPCRLPQADGMGLRTMQYRAALIGGKLEVGPASHGGTRVVCRLIPQRLV